jgi:hypothetical protein
MPDAIKFVNNYSDLSNEMGFQFEFNCNRCSTGYRTKFKAAKTAAVSNALGLAGSLFGGLFSTASEVSNNVKTVTWQKSHDEAMENSIKEISPSFIQCPRCQSWVCREKCWNQEKGLCKGCAPDLGVEASAAQADRTREEIWAHAKVADGEKPSDVDWNKKLKASCPKCEAALPKNTKFCPNCGTDVTKSSTCVKCKANLVAGAKFCAECGEKV